MQQNSNILPSLIGDRCRRRGRPLRVIRVPQEGALDTINAMFNVFDGYRGWERPLTELESLFVEAGQALAAERDGRREAQLEIHEGRWALSRWWQELCGWRPPEPGSCDAALAHLIERCRMHSHKLEELQFHPFYRETDMRPYITKPLLLAERLEKHLPH